MNDYISESFNSIQVNLKGREKYCQHLRCFYKWLDAETSKFAFQFIFHDLSHGIN